MTEGQQRGVYRKKTQNGKLTRDAGKLPAPTQRLAEYRLIWVSIS